MNNKTKVTVRAVSYNLDGGKMKISLRATADGSFQIRLIKKQF